MSTQVRKGNKILVVSEDAVERYINMGYSVINDKGEIVTKATPVDTTQLKCEYTRMSEEISKLKDEIASLKEVNASLVQENKNLAKQLGETKTASPVTEDEDKDEVKVEKPTRRRKQTTEDKAE